MTYSRILLVCLVAFILSHIAFAQRKQTSGKLSSSKAINKTADRQVQPVDLRDVLVLKVTANAACKFYVDGEFKGDLNPDKILKVNLQKGSYRLSATSKANKAQSWQQDYEVVETNQQKFFEIDILTVINAGAKVADEGKPENEGKGGKANANNVIEPEMVKVEGGKMKMGDNGKLYTVNTFSIGKYEVTQKQWESVMGTNPSKNKGCPDCPVEMVTYDDCQNFITKLNSLTGKKYRLPTTTEWEFAYRGGNLSNIYKYSGNNVADLVAWYDKNSNDKSHPVGQKLPNELGIYDMSGNVWEWVEGWWGEPGGKRVSRGGGYAHESKDLEFLDWYAFKADVGTKTPDFGLRLVLSSK